MSKKKVIILSGPTASGKTEMSLSLAKKYNGFIISADSRQIYKNMDIGTAKPAGEHRFLETDLTDVKLAHDIDTAYYIDDIPHFLIDHIKPDVDYTLADWQEQALALLKDKKINSQFSNAFIVGGTGLYISSLTKNYSLPAGHIDEQLRNFLTEQPLAKLQQQLKAKSPATYEFININNPRRVVRALEYVLTNNQDFIPQQKNSTDSPYEYGHLSIAIDRDTLYQRINQRVEVMIKNGLVDEVKNLLEKYDHNLSSLSGIGYAEIKDYLYNEITLEQAIEKIKQHSRNYAKRQITWFKRDNKIIWVKNLDEADEKIEKFIK